MIQFTRTEQQPRMSLDQCVGALPYCWDASDPRPAIVQHDERQMGNGPFRKQPDPKWKWSADDHGLRYPGDPAMFPLATAKLPLSGEMILVYPHAWVAIVQTGANPRLVSVDRRD